MLSVEGKSTCLTVGLSRAHLLRAWGVTINTLTRPPLLRAEPDVRTFGPYLVPFAPVHSAKGGPDKKDYAVSLEFYEEVDPAESKQAINVRPLILPATCHLPLAPSPPPASSCKKYLLRSC